MSSINDSYEDVVHGIDFTGINPQTASEHNQLVDQATPYTSDGSGKNGVSFVLTSTDTALNTPDVPNPNATNNYKKWYRYIWARRIYVDGTTYIPAFYVWVDSMNSDATFLKWQIADPASNTTIGGALGTALQTAINSLNTSAVNSAAAAATANTNTTNLQTATFGANPLNIVGASNLWNLFSITQAGQITDAANITAIQAAVNTIDTEITALQDSLTSGISGAANVANLTPGTRAGMNLITSLGSSGPGAPAWNDPLSNQNLITDPGGPAANESGAVTGATSLTSVQVAAGFGVYTVTLPVGWWLITAATGGQARSNATTDKFTGLWLQATIGGATIKGPSVLMNSPSGIIVETPPCTLMCVGVVLVTASGTLTLSIKGTVSGTPNFDSSGSVNFVAQRISVANS